MKELNYELSNASGKANIFLATY